MMTALARHIRPDAQHSAAGLPFPGGSALARRPEHHPHTPGPQRLQQRPDRLPFQHEAGGLADQRLDLFQTQGRIAHLPPIDIANATTGDRLGAGLPAAIAGIQLAEQQRIPFGVEGKITGQEPGALGAQRRLKGHRPGQRRARLQQGQGGGSQQQQRGTQHRPQQQAFELPGQFASPS